MQIAAMGMAWYKSEEDYLKLKSLFTDSHKLPLKYSDWLSKAELGFKELSSSGHIVEKAYLDPDTFPDWCRSHNFKLDADARTAFASEFVAKKYGPKA